MEEQKYKILVVDDNRDFIQYIKEALSDCFEVMPAETGKQGIEQSASMAPDLVLLDVNLSDMDGIEFARKITVNPKTRFIPVIVISASSYNVVTERMIRNEPSVKAFISKLTPIDNLKELIFQTIKRKI